MVAIEDRSRYCRLQKDHKKATDRLRRRWLWSWRLLCVAWQFFTPDKSAKNDGWRPALWDGRKTHFFPLSLYFSASLHNSIFGSLEDEQVFFSFLTTLFRLHRLIDLQWRRTFFLANDDQNVSHTAKKPSVIKSVLQEGWDLLLKGSATALFLKSTHPWKNPYLQQKHSFYFKSAVHARSLALYTTFLSWEPASNWLTDDPFGYFLCFFGSPSLSLSLALRKIPSVANAGPKSMRERRGALDSTLEAMNDEDCRLDSTSLTTRRE